MSPVSATFRRTVGRARSFYSTVFALAGFLAGAAALFAFNLSAHEGTLTALLPVWTVSASPLLPIFAALTGMSVFSDEYKSGGVDLLLTAPVLEREIVLGKFFGVWALSVFAITLHLVSSLVVTGVMAPALLSDLSAVDILPALFVLLMQSALWCSVAVAASAMFTHAAMAATVTAVAVSGVPWAIWFAVLNWLPEARQRFGEMPVDAHAFELAGGFVSTGLVLSYFILTVTALFIATKLLALRRLVGAGAKPARFSTYFTFALAAALAVSSIVLVNRLDFTTEIPVSGSGEVKFSSRTCDLLRETSGSVAATVFLSRHDGRFRTVRLFLRSLVREAEAQGGLKLILSTVDPNWDLFESERLIRLGVKPGSVVFERGNRRMAVPVSAAPDENVCAAALVQVAVPNRPTVVRWTTGHRELSTDDYGQGGLSDLARDLACWGYSNVKLDLAGDQPIPADGVVVIAGPRDDFSRAEIAKLDAMMKAGGRLMVFIDSDEPRSLVTMLSQWGMRLAPVIAPENRTLSGNEIVVTDLSSHEICAPLAGSRLVAGRGSIGFTRSAAADGGSGADRIEYRELAGVAPMCIAAVAERGNGAGSDLSIRPTRLVAVGDSGMVQNGSLEARGNANREFILNAFSYLSGSAFITGSGVRPRLESGLDRYGRLRMSVVSAVAIPAVLFLALLVIVYRRNHRR